jgi:hypothetical protein
LFEKRLPVGHASHKFSEAQRFEKKELKEVEFRKCYFTQLSQITPQKMRQNRTHSKKGLKITKITKKYDKIARK